MPRSRTECPHYIMLCACVGCVCVCTEQKGLIPSDLLSWLLSYSVYLESCVRVSERDLAAVGGEVSGNCGFFLSLPP